MTISDGTIATLRDSIRANTVATRKKNDLLHISILLDLVKLGLINQDTLYSDPTYKEYYGSKTKRIN